VDVAPDDPRRDDVTALLSEHLADMRATSPPESVHALDVDALVDPRIAFFSARDGDVLLGCGALKLLSEAEGEVKSMRTTHAARGRGVAAAILARLLEEARKRGLRRVSLETGTEDYFAAAHRLYARHGFVDCGPFGDYALDPHSRFMKIALD
jgi:putative acetyltransferase